MLAIVVYVPPTILHGTGIILLYKSRGELPNQRVITLNLATAEFLFCTSRVILHSVILAGVSHTVTLTVLYCSVYITFCATRFAILHIILDRFLDIWLNIKYPRYVNKANLIKIIIFLWFISTVIAVTFVFLETFKIVRRDKPQFGRLTGDIIIVFAAISTFIYLFKKVKSVLHRQDSQEKRPRRSTGVWFKLRIPLLMVITFIVFNTTSTILWLYRDDSDEAKYYAYALVLDLFGWCSDAFIYVFLQRRVRRLLVSCCRRTRKNRNGGNRMNQLSQPTITLQV